MKHTAIQWMAPAILCVMVQPAHAAYEAVSSSGSTVLKECQGIPGDPTPPASGTCKVTGTLPGETGYTQIRTNNNQAVYANGTQIGDLDDRVWYNASTGYYIFGMRLQLTNTTWTPPSSCGSTTPTYFEVNDMFRNGFSSVSNVSVAYKLASAEEGMWVAGRTNQGLGEYTGAQPARNNNWVDARTDVNYEDPDGTRCANSSWMLVKMQLPGGVSSSPVSGTIRLWEGGEEGQCQYQILLNGFKPN